ncbi:MAG: DUF11 domain-containing protein, partial [bacterium]|nr:DUF11 domain-containing protein [bacterium]
GVSIPLSTLIPATYPTGIFAGYDRVVLHTNDTVYDIALPSGVVTNLGSMPAPSFQACESWAWWGVAEYFGGSVYLVYRASTGPIIVRTRVPDGLTTTVAAFFDLSDMCSFTVSPVTGRWYFHHEWYSQFGGYEETLGFCNATVGVEGLADLSVIQTDSADPATVGESFSYTLTVTNHGPDSATGARVRHRLPGTLDLVSVMPSQGSCAEDCNGLTCDLGLVSVGAGVTVTIDAVPQAGGLLTTSTMAFSEQTDLDPANDEVFDETVVHSQTTTGTLLSITWDQLRAIDPNTGSTLASRPITLEEATISGAFGLATHPITGKLWALLGLSEQSGHELATIDPLNGVATRVGDTGDSFVGLAFDSAGTLYGVREPSEELFILSQEDATPTFVLPMADGSSGEAIGFNPMDGLLYRASGRLTFQSIDPGDLTITDILGLAACAVPFARARALTHLDGDTLLLVDGFWSRLSAVTTAGALRTIGPMDHYSRGLAFVEDLPLADLSITLTDSPDPVTVGANLTYSLSVANDGPDDLPEVTVLQSLPGTVRLVSLSPSQGICEVDRCGGEISCALGELPSGSHAMVTIEVTPLAAGRLSNTASAPALNDPDLTNNRVVWETTVHPEPGTATLLSIAAFSNQLRAIDPQNGATLAAGTITLEGEPIHGGNGLATHPLTGEPWALLRLKDQEGRELVILSPAAGVAWRVGNTGDDFAGLAFDSDGTLYGVTGTWADTPGALFILSQTDASPTFVLSLADGREGEAIAFHAADGLLYHASGWGSELSFRSIDLNGLTITSIATCGSSGRTEALTDLGGDVMLLADDYRHLYGITSGGGLRGIGSMDHESTGLAFVDVDFADLAVTMSDAADPITVGEDLTLTLTVTNNGPEEVPSVIVFGTLPGSFEPARLSPSQGVCATAPCAEGLICALGALDAGQDATVTIEVTPLVAGTGTSTAFAPALGDPDLDNNLATRTTTVLPGTSVPALLSIDAEFDRLRIIDPSDGTTAATFTITLEGETVVGGNGLATDPLTGELWALLRLQGRSGRELVTLDPATGAATRVGDTLDRFAGLAFDSDGTLYGVTGRGADTPEALFILSQSDATSTWVLSLADGSGGEAIAFGPADGLLYHASGELAFRAIDLSETTVTTIADCNAPSPAPALTYLGGNTLLLADRGSSLFALTTSGSLTQLGSLDHRSKGLALVGLDLAALASRAPRAAQDRGDDLPEPGATTFRIEYQTVKTRRFKDLRGIRPRLLAAEGAVLYPEWARDSHSTRIGSVSGEGGPTTRAGGDMRQDHAAYSRRDPPDAA